MGHKILDMTYPLSLWAQRFFDFLASWYVYVRTPGTTLGFWQLGRIAWNNTVRPLYEKSQVLPMRQPVSAYNAYPTPGVPMTVDQQAKKGQLRYG